uniref:Uncharacterized protein n=1 Tax=Rhizobium phage IG49 TaxID=3129228 RepID=A0AAU8HYU3_9CAUD
MQVKIATTETENLSQLQQAIVNIAANDKAVKSATGISFYSNNFMPHVGILERFEIGFTLNRNKITVELEESRKWEIVDIIYEEIMGDIDPDLTFSEFVQKYL